MEWAKLFNYVIMFLYTTNIFWWIYHNNVGQAWYWASALSITAAVTWGMKY